ncbi:Kinesin-like protein kif21b [Mortierella hygrophila]|uniref:Kinesin-like protein kif21b n=1 Tax=Mortierella hygrophila TaxID=979708 RepID=A0A9P6K2R6_9FUNG|nr:Kinesin-like protein kif21b [Mortierella hygrophila]
MNTAVKVALRVRPLTLQEQISNCSECISYVPNEPQIGIVGSDKSFTFDYVFDEESNQRNVYEQCSKELVERFIEGFNVTILAYGQTGSGKTYSMGTGLQYQGNPDPAIVPRAAHEIFQLLDAQMEKDPAMEYQVYVSFLELYNEELIDLLQTQPRTRKDTIQVREDGFGGISWQGVKEQQVASAHELLDWLQKGSLCRTTAATDMNQTSSRSHAIFSVILKQQRTDEPDPTPEGEEEHAAAVAPTKTPHEKPLKKLASKFHFVDLAGSERLKRTRAVGDRAKEGISINSGLLALGNVISALGDESRKSSHVPYRDSKLTRLLQDSLGGNSATLMLACVSGADADVSETISTLVYANRARNIRNRVVINQDFRDSTNSEIAQLRAEINRLKMENGSFRVMGSGPATELDQRRAAEEMRSLRGEVTRLRERLRESSSELCDVLAERDTLLVEREVTGDADIEAHPIMMTYHHTVMQLKDRLIAAEDQALELQTLLSQKPQSVFGRRPNGPNRQKAPSPFKRRVEPMTDDDHDADGEHEDGHHRKDSSPPRGRTSKRKSRQSSRAVSRFDFGAAAAALGIEPSKLPTSPPIPQVEQLLSSGGASNWFQSLKTTENQPLSAHLDYSSASSSLPPLPNDSDSSHSFSRRRRAGRHGSGGVAETLDKAKEDIRRGLLLLKAEKNGMGMDMDLLNMLDPTAPMQLRPSPASSRRRGSATSSLSSGSNRSRFQSTMPTLEDVIGVRSPMSPMRQSFPFPPPSVASGTSWKESTSPQDQKVFFEAEQKAAETLANAMKAMNRFSFPLSASDALQMNQQQQQNRLAAAIQQQKAAAVALPDSDAGSSFDSSSIHGGSFHGGSHRASSHRTGSNRPDSHSLQSLHSLALSLTDPDTSKAILGPFAAAAAAGSVAAGSSGSGGSQSGGSHSLESLQSLARSLTNPDTNKAIAGPFAAAAAAGSAAASGSVITVPLPTPVVQAPVVAAAPAADKPNYDMMLNEVQSGIAIKEELVHQLEKAEAEYHHMRDQYEEEIRAMEERILFITLLLIPGSVKVKYETKIKQLMAELSDLQHKYSEVSKVANEKRTLAENQLRTLRVAVDTLKAEKVRMVKRMKEDAERIKEMNAANDREIQALRRSEKAALEARKKAEREMEQHQQRATAMLHRNSNANASNGASTQQAKVIGFLKKPQTPKGITKTAAKRPTRLNGPSDRKDAQASAIPAPTKASTKGPGSIRSKVAQKKQVIDRAIYGYISGQHAINVMEDMLKKRERLKSEKQELEAERLRVVQAQEENAIANGSLLLDFASEPQYMDDRITMIDAEVAYINARIRALQAEAAALGFVTAIEKNHQYSDEETGLDGTRDEEELMTKLIRQGMAEDAMGLPPGSGASVAFESSVTILRSMDLGESREFLEMLFEDMVTVRGHENGLQVQVSNQEKVIEELKRALQAMRQAAVGATLGYEKRCDGLEQKLRLLGGSSDHLNGRRAIGDGSSEDDEYDAEVARLNRAAFQQQHGESEEEETMKSPILNRQQSKDSLWTPVPEAAHPRSGSAAAEAMDIKAKRASTIFDQLYEDAIKTSDEASPKVGGTGGEFSRILMANNEQRRVSWAGVPASQGLGNHSSSPAQEPISTNNSNPHHQLPPMPPSRPGLARSSSTSAVNTRGNAHGNESAQQRNTSMYGHRRAGSTSGGSAGAQAIAINNGSGLHRNASMSRLSNSAPNHGNDAHFYQQQLAQQGQHLQQKGIYASTASSRQHAETIAARRSSTPISSPAIGPKSTARPRLSSGYGANNADAPLPSPMQNPRRGGTPLTIQTGFPNGHPPQHTLRHAKSHQQPLNSQRQLYDSRRASTPSPSPGKRLSRSDSDGVALASQSNHTRGHTTNAGNGRPLSRMGTANMITTTATATNLVHGMASPGLNAFNNTSAGADGYNGHHEVYHTHHHNGSASRRISGSWDDNQNVYERLASVHTQASQARLLATRNSVYTSAPAGGSMMSTGNMSSIGFHQIQQQAGGRSTPQMRMNHRPSIDGMMSMAAVAAAAAAHANGEGADSGSSSSVTSASTTTSTLTTATNSPTHHESSGSNGHEGESSLSQVLAKAEVGTVF